MDCLLERIIVQMTETFWSSNSKFILGQDETFLIFILGCIDIEDVCVLVDCSISDEVLCQLGQHTTDKLNEISEVFRLSSGDSLISLRLWIEHFISNVSV